MKIRNLAMIIMSFFSLEIQAATCKTYSDAAGNWGITAAPIFASDLGIAGFAIVKLDNRGAIQTISYANMFNNQTGERIDGFASNFKSGSYTLDKSCLLKASLFYRDGSAQYFEGYITSNKASLLGTLYTHPDWNFSGYIAVSTFTASKMQHKLMINISTISLDTPGLKKTVLILLIIINLNGCSVYKVITQPGPADTDGIGVGTARQELISRLGPPKAIDTDKNGNKIDMFEFESGMHHASKMRAILYLAGDFFTLFLTELIFWPMELTILESDICHGTAMYDNTQKITSWQMTRKNGRPGC